MRAYLNAEERHAKLVADAAGAMIALADDTGRSLIDVLADVERFIVEKTKVGDAAREGVEPGQRGYTLRDGRLVEVR